jgi:spore maturation protein SpmA
MARPDPEPQDDRTQVKLVAIVLVGTMALWLGAQEIGREYGLPMRFALLFDLAAIAGFLWAMIVTYRIWRRRQR